MGYSNGTGPDCALMPIFGLIDGNSFYCSCQRAFEPKLKRRPVVVLSNNDGCAIARTHDYVELQDAVKHC
ncbi:Y-family DNA polymerase [Neokomagataea tanensis]